jgi:carbamoylphosphate synthase large subunit
MGNVSPDRRTNRLLSSNSLVNDGKDMEAVPLQLINAFEPPVVLAETPSSDDDRAPREAYAAPVSPGAPAEGAGLSRASTRDPHILLATTGKLSSTARMAMELRDAGAMVSLLAPANHPAAVLDILSHKLIYSALTPHRTLEAVLLRLAPDAVIPCDERTVRDLHALYRSTRHHDVRAVIERSVGPPSSYPAVTSRAELLALAERLGARVPASMAIPDAAALDHWISHHPAPFVLKADGSWSGFGVRIISNTAMAQQALSQMTRPSGLYLAIREAVLEGDRFGLRAWLRRERPVMSAQGYVDGWPANIGVACWKGEVLAATCVESVSTRSATGPSTVARIIQNSEMVDTAQRIVRALGLSGLIGFDFMIEAATEAAYLIEMNPRNTPICAIRLGPGRDLPEALVAQLASRPVRERPARTDRDIIAFFPDTWQLDPASSFLQSGYHDVPWEQPALVRILLKPELRDRFWIMRKLSQLRRRFRDRNGPIT